MDDSSYTQYYVMRPLDARGVPAKVGDIVRYEECGNEVSAPVVGFVESGSHHWTVRTAYGAEPTTFTIEPTLFECPFCGNRDAKLVSEPSKMGPQGKRFRIRCLCGAMTKQFDSRDEAIRFWNVRAERLEGC